MSKINNEKLAEHPGADLDEKDNLNGIKALRTADGQTRAVHLPRKSSGRIASLPILLYIVLAAVILIAAFTGSLPDSMLAGFVTTILFGGLLIWVGNLFPVIRDFGLPTILCTFIPATLLFAGWLPEQLVTVVTNFVTVHGFLDFFVITVIAGSILGMPRALLLKAGPRFAVPLVGCLVVTFAVIGGIGMITGFGFVEAILMVAAPIMAGGLGLGALPMSEMYAARTGQDSSAFMGDLMSAVVVANIFCIIIAGIYNGLGKRKKQLFVGFNGNGQLLRVAGKRGDLTLPPKRDVSSFIALGKGLVIAGGLFVFGQLVGSFAEFLHPYAWTIIAAALVKIFGLLPKEVEDATTDWGDMVTATMVPALLVGVSISYIDISEVLASLSSPRFLFLTVATVVVATLSSGFLGWLVKFYFVEASITPGLVMADTGGSGDVSVLSAANRMHLMPFAALTNRIGGALVLFITSMMVPLLAG